MPEEEKHTVLILGAGSNAEYGFPTGRKLAQKIYQGYVAFCQRCKRPPEEIAEAHYFTRQLRILQRGSIDDYLQDKDDYRDMACEAIAYCLMQHESTNGLFKELDKEHLYGKLFDMLAPPGCCEDFPHHKLSIITYNYDRSLEYFFGYRLAEVLDLDHTSPDLKKLVAELPVVHVHGRFGTLPWLDGPEDEIPFDLNNNDLPVYVELAANSIKMVFDDDVPDSKNYQDARNLLSTADTVIFLGFGFHPTNLANLRLTETLSRKPGIYGTVKGLTHSRYIEIRDYFLDNFQTDPTLEDCDCLSLVKDFGLLS